MGSNDVKHAIIARKSHFLQVLLVVFGLTLAAAIRWFTDRGANGVPFATFLPVVVLASIFLDRRYAAATAVLSLVIARQLFGVTLPREHLPAIVLFVAYAVTGIFLVIVGSVLRTTILELHRQSEQFSAYNAELQHRAKNALQVVRALASRASKARDPVEFYESLANRMDLMIKANELLGVGNLRRCELGELVGIAIAPFLPGAITVSGPPVQVADDAAVPLVMVFHELGTNALKYGSLSADSGLVRINWTADANEIDILWQESGGPAVTPPTKRGLGSRLLVAQGALKTVDLSFEPTGVICRIRVPRAE